jgi:hypothetical protein
MGRIRWDEPDPSHFKVDLVITVTQALAESARTLQLVDGAAGCSMRQTCDQTLGMLGLAKAATKFYSNLFKTTGR